MATMEVLDMRSDTVTKPTDAMREAMRLAEVGDDVYGDDATVNRLEQKAAALLGKEAALFVPTGTMGNLICVLTHCRTRGEEFIVGSDAHILVYEQGGSAQLGGVHPRALPNNKDGTIDIDAMEQVIFGDDDTHHAVTRLICLENTHNRCGGRILKTSYVDAVGELAKKHGLKLHIDGARLMNAAMALGEDPARMCKAADSVSLCLSKALGAPIGSVIVGTNDFIFQARRLRKALGGGMRQVGVIAAPATIALEEMPKRLHIDHANAKRLAEGLVKLQPYGLTVDLQAVETNIVFLELTRSDIKAQAVFEKFKARGIWLNVFSDRRIRLTLHHHITQEHVDRIIAAAHEVAKELPPMP